MTELTKRATVYLEPELHRALKLKAVETSCSISELVNDALRENLLEDAPTHKNRRWALGYRRLIKFGVQSEQ